MNSDKCVDIALKFIKKNKDYTDFIKNYNNPRGFTYSRNYILDIINDEINIHECKSVSFEVCMEICRQKLNLENNNTYLLNYKSN